MTETLLDNPTSSTPKIKKTNLDQGFPTGLVLLSLLGIVFFTQGISAWKIMNLEHERATFDAKKSEFDSIQRELPQLENQKKELQEIVLRSQGELTSLTVQQQKLESGIKSARSVNEDLQIKIEGANSRLKELNNQYDERKKEKEEVVLRHKQLSDEADALDSKVKSYKLEMATLASSLDNLKKEETQKASNVARLEAREDELNKLRSSLSDIIVGLKTETINLEKSNQDGKEHFKSAIQSFDTAMQNVKTSLTKWDEQISNMRSAGAEVKTHIEESQSSFKISAGDLSEAASQAHEVINRFDMEIAELQKKRSDLSAIEQTLEAALNKVQSAEEHYATISKSIPADIKGLKEDLSSVLKQLQELNNSQRALEKQVSNSLKKKS